jgi:hypothetical protein
MAKYFLADIKRKVYDPTPFKTWKSAVRMNMVAQIYNTDDFMYVVPLKQKEIIKSKFKQEKLLPK